MEETGVKQREVSEEDRKEVWNRIEREERRQQRKKRGKNKEIKIK